MLYKSIFVVRNLQDPNSKEEKDFFIKKLNQ
jgi:hypothetical protein